jgi:hypothetical protein
MVYLNIILCDEFEVLTVEITVFSNTTPCSVAKFYRRFKETIPIFRVED